MIALLTASLLTVSLLAVPALAQPPDSTTFAPPADSAAVAPSSAAPRMTSKVARTSEEMDRLELGVGRVKGFFDAAGSLGYRRFMAQGPALEQSFMLELTGASKNRLTEGALSFSILFRPSATYRESWRLRPLLEFGPAGHLVVQVVSLEGLNRTRYKSQIYVKTHAYAGFEALLTRRWGVLVRGRASIPSHRPFDYAQAAIFLR